MAGSLGTLTLDLIAKIGSFTGPLDKASQEAKKRNAEIAKSFENLAKGVGVALAGVPAVLAAMVVSSANTAKEISNQAALAGLGTTEFQKYAAGARTVGIEQDKLADIFKDTNDKLGDFANTGGGALKDFFTNIAPLVGVTADQFKKLSSKDALALYVTSLEKANVNQQEMTFYMEAIASDSTALVPLLRNSGKAFDELGQAALDAGVIMDGPTIAAAKQFGVELIGLEQYLTSSKTILAAEFLPVLAQFTKDLNASAKEAGGLKGVVGDLGEKLVESTAFVVNAGDGVGRVFKIVANTIVGMFGTAIGHTDALASQAYKALSVLSFGDTSKEFAANSARFAEDAKIQFGVAAQAAGAITDSLDSPLLGDKFKEMVAKAKQGAVKLAKANQPTTLGKGSGVDPAAIAAAAAASKKAASDAASAAKKIQDSFGSAETDLLRQIDLINTSTDATKNATEADKLHFEIASGKLVGINAEQQKRLESLAAELDGLEKLKKANEDNAKAMAFAANLATANQGIRSGFDQQLAGAGLGDRAKDRLQNDLGIQQEYYEKQADLFEQYNTKQISPELYAKQTEALSDALAERMVIQQDFYNQEDEARSNWLDGVSSAWENYKDTATDYQQQAADFTAQTLDTLSSSTADAFMSIIDGSASAGEALKNLASTMVNSVVSALVKMAAQWVVYKGVQLALGATGSAAAVAQALASGTAIAAAYAPAAAMASLASFGTNSVPAIAGITATTAAAEGAALLGMAHDGIDSVPQTGTWLLQKGERVTTAETSAKLDKTLQQVQNNRASGGAPVVQIIEDASKAGQTQYRNSNGENSLQVFISNLMSDGEVYQAMQQKFGLSTVGS